MPAYKKGERVNYKPVGGKSSRPEIHTPKNPHAYNVTLGPQSHTSQSVGVIREIATQAGASMTGRQVEASEEEPRYQVC